MYKLLMLVLCLFFIGCNNNKCDIDVSKAEIILNDDTLFYQECKIRLINQGTSNTYAVDDYVITQEQNGISSWVTIEPKNVKEIHITF